MLDYEVLHHYSLDARSRPAMTKRDIVSFRLDIRDAFRLSDGGTTLLGGLGGSAAAVRPAVAQLWVDGEPGPRVHVDGERMPGRATPHLRSVHIAEAVDIDVKKHRYVLTWDQ